MISHNLQPLIRCRFVHMERRGKKRIYHVSRETVETLFNAVKNHAKRYCPTDGEMPVDDSGK